MSATTRVVTPVTNAATKTYSYSGIDLLDVDVATLTDQIDVYLTPASTGIQRLLSVTTDFTYAALPTQTITLEGATATSLAEGDIVTIRRSTKDDARYTDFTDLGFLRSEDVNTNGDQLLFLIQENRTDVQDALLKTDDQTKWQGENLPSTNCANAADSTGWATLGQVVALVAGGEPLNVGTGIYFEADGTGSKTEYSLPSFPTTDISNAKIFVTIDGIVQRPGVDYTYTLDVDSVPTINFQTGAPPSGSGNIQFRVLPGVVTTTYDAASLDGDVIIDNTLDGAALIDATVDGDALVDQSVDLDKLDAGNTGVADRFLSSDGTGVVTANVLTFSDITTTGAGARTDITNSEITEEVTTSTNIVSGPYNYTNSGSTTLMGIFSISSFHGGGNIQMTPSGGSAVVMGSWVFSGGAVNNLSYSFLIPPGASIAISGAGSDKLNRFITMEV